MSILFTDISIKWQVFYRQKGQKNMETEVWGYARVSTTEQNLARQLEQLKEFGIPDRNATHVLALVDYMERERYIS